MSKICDNKSVGMLVWKEDKLFLIERKKPPFGFAPPAGHLDEDGNDFEKAAKRELLEEVGLVAKNLKLIFEGRKENACRREGGIWHYWKIYQVGVAAESEVKRSEDETKQAGWYSQDDLQKFAERTEQYLREEISEQKWQNSPGLEIVWYEIFKELKII